MPGEATQQSGAVAAPGDDPDARAFDLDAITDDDLALLAKLLESVDRDMRFNKLEVECWDLEKQYPRGKAPYDWQQEFFAAGADCQRRGLIAANQVGKTITAAREIAMHLTGRYPAWWTGRRYNRPVMPLCATNGRRQSSSAKFASEPRGPSDWR